MAGTGGGGGGGGNCPYFFSWNFLFAIQVLSLIFRIFPSLFIITIWLPFPMDTEISFPSSLTMVAVSSGASGAAGGTGGTGGGGGAGAIMAIGGGGGAGATCSGLSCACTVTMEIQATHTKIFFFICNVLMIY